MLEKLFMKNLLLLTFFSTYQYDSLINWQPFFNREKSYQGTPKGIDEIFTEFCISSKESCAYYTNYQARGLLNRPNKILKEFLFIGGWKYVEFFFWTIC